MGFWDTYKVEVILIIITYLGWETYGTYEISKTGFLCGLFYVGYRWLGDYLWRQKYRSPHVICDNLSASCVKSDDRGIFRFFELGGVKNMPEEVSEHHLEGTLIVPIESCARLGEHHYSLCQIQAISIEQLPMEVRDFLESKEYNQNVIYYGQASKAAFLSKPNDLVKFVTEKKQNTIIAEQEDIIADKYKIKLDFAQTMGIVEKERKPWEIWKKKEKKEDDVDAD